MPVDPWIVSYYLHLLPGVPGYHARRRLTMLSCDDASPEPVAKKVLDRPRLLARLADAVRDPRSAHMTCFTCTELEKALALRLDVPLYACDPSLADLGGKSGGRRLFREAGVPVAEGYEGLRDEGDVVAALVELRRRQPGLRRALLKRDDGTSGEGNALFSYEHAPHGTALEPWVRRQLPRRLSFMAEDEDWARYRERFARVGGVVEAMLEGLEVRSPSVQCRVDPLGRVQMISTHDQILGGRTGLVFQGSTFPADLAYRLEIQEAGRRVAERLRDRGVLGRFGVDFVSVRGEAGWEHFASEVNLRKGGTTHTYLMLQYLTDGRYDESTGLFHTAQGLPRCYHATDNLQDEAYRQLTPEDLVDVAVERGLHFDATTQTGVVFHLIGAIAQHGKVGVTCVEGTPESARGLFAKVVGVLDEETARRPAGDEAAAAEDVSGGSGA